MITALAEIDQIEASFIASIDRGEQALAAAETDYERLEVRDAARAAQVARLLVLRFCCVLSGWVYTQGVGSPIQSSGGKQCHTGMAHLRKESAPIAREAARDRYSAYSPASPAGERDT